MATEDRTEEPRRKLPDQAVCRATRCDTGRLVLCVVPDAKNCQHAECFPTKTYCFHPDAWQIVSRSARTAEGRNG